MSHWITFSLYHSHNVNDHGSEKKGHRCLLLHDGLRLSDAGSLPNSPREKKKMQNKHLETNVYGGAEAFDFVITVKKTYTKIHLFFFQGPKTVLNQGMNIICHFGRLHEKVTLLSLVVTCDIGFQPEICS